MNCFISSHLADCNSLLYGSNGYKMPQLQFWQDNATQVLSLRRKCYYITPVPKDLYSKESNAKCCRSLINLSIVKPLHVSPSCCLCILQTGPCDQRPNIFLEYQDAVWKGLADVAPHILIYPFGTHSLHLLNVPLHFMPSRAARRLIYLMWHIPRYNDCYFVWLVNAWISMVCCDMRHMTL